MHLLIKRRRNPGPGAHIPDAEGQPLCKLPLKLDQWQVIDDDPNQHLICGQCRRLRSEEQAKKPIQPERT